MTNLETYQKALIDLSKQYKNQQQIANLMLSLMFATEPSQNDSFHDKELHDKVLQLVTFFNRKYSGVPSCKSDSDKVSEVPIFNRSS